MFKPSIALFILPVLLTLPAGIASARDLDVQAGNVRVTIDQANGIRVQSANGETIVVPSHAASDLSGLPSVFTMPSAADRYQVYRSNQPVTFGNPQITQTLHCSGSGYAQQTAQSYSFGTGSNQSHTTSTNVCR